MQGRPCNAGHARQSHLERWARFSSTALPHKGLPHLLASARSSAICSAAQGWGGGWLTSLGTELPAEQQEPQTRRYT
jgi:hypothetical protein